MPIAWHLVSTEWQGGGGGDGGAAVQQATFCSAVLLSCALVVVQVGSTVQGGTQETTRHTIRPMQSTFWLHCPYRN